ncbi:hypothetical protein RR46_12419 [Papilio xuthus]|uniref:Uncharacterized protein n=1 Tax=Papilio xuthus TaxID=66420 RepID=A0A194PUG1_PAPXU|nr:hypothetical protein RR46_12419 [Papilio xuthus]
MAFIGPRNSAPVIRDSLHTPAYEYKLVDLTKSKFISELTGAKWIGPLRRYVNLGRKYYYIHVTSDA